MRKKYLKSKTKKYLFFLAILLIAGIWAVNKYFAQVVASQKETQSVLKDKDILTKTLPKETAVKTPTSNKEVSAVKTNTAEKTPAPPLSKTGATFSDGSEIDTPPSADILVKEVVFDGKSFSPKTVNILVGDYIIFKNASSVDFWPASDPHPSHTNFPAFDSGKAVVPGGYWQFQFTNPGEFGFHDHLHPDITGKVAVLPK